MFGDDKSKLISNNKEYRENWIVGSSWQGFEEIAGKAVDGSEDRGEVDIVLAIGVKKGGIACLENALASTLEQDNS